MKILNGSLSQEENPARRLGRLERNVGRRYSDNPYSKMSGEHDQWAAGWSAEQNNNGTFVPAKEAA